jgi:hypothetical protein
MKISVFFKKRYLLKIPKNSDKKEVLGGSPLFNNKVIEKKKQKYKEIKSKYSVYKIY